MLGKFFYGQFGLSEAFWKFSVLGLTVCGGLTRLFRILLMQSVNYEKNYFRVMITSLSFMRDNTTTLPYFCCYTVLFIALVVYCIICVVGMWRTYKEYEKSKFLALMCFVIVLIFASFLIKTSIY
jgi:hypothetical protein